jgi:hypothetical protein
MHMSVIAGPSNVGKSTAARALAEMSGARVLEVDDLARRSTLAALAFERDPSVWSKAPATLSRFLVEKGDALWPQILDWIRTSLDAERPTIIEGEGPSPEHLHRARQDFELQAMFVIEPDPGRLHDTLTQRSRSFRNLPLTQQSNVIQMNVLYGEWLRQECERVGLPWTESQPWATLHARCADAFVR